MSSIQDLLNKPIIHGGLTPLLEKKLNFASPVPDASSATSTPKGHGIKEGFKRPSPPAAGEETSFGGPKKRARSSLFPRRTLEIGNVGGGSKSTIYRIEETTVSTTFSSARDVLKNSTNTHQQSVNSVLITATATTASEILKGSNNENEKVVQSEKSIKIAVERIDSDPNLVGDGSTWHVLPIMPIGKHSDLKEITSTSLVGLINGDYKDVVDSFEIVDCRYPYEYDAGHIKGAINLHTKGQIQDHFIASREGDGKEDKPESDRHVIIFHCEFSSQRGPDMCRHVRELDRKANEYPKLYYPEVYVLFGGYKRFFEQYQKYCDPEVYLPMDHPDHVENCRFYKSLSKTDVGIGRQNSKKAVGKMVRQSSMKKLCLDQL